MNVGPQLDLIVLLQKLIQVLFDVCKWPTTLSSIIRSADTALIDQGADHTDEQVKPRFSRLFQMNLLYLEEQVKV